MNKKLIAAAVFLISASFYSQNVGINTNKPDASAILEVSADAPPTSSVTTKKGILYPEVALTDIYQKVAGSTITNANGLLVFNTTTTDISVTPIPTNLVGSRHYYWDGTKWTRLIVESTTEIQSRPQVYYLEDATTQTFTIPTTDAGSVNYTGITGPNSGVALNFTGMPIINTNNLLTFNDTNNTFTVNVAGYYDVSIFANYNPNSTNNNCYLNLKLQKNVGGTWTTLGDSRTAWGIGTTNMIKTAIANSLVFSLSKGDVLRIVISNPFPTSQTHGNGTTQPSIVTTPNNPIAKGVRFQLLNYNLL